MDLRNAVVRIIYLILLATACTLLRKWPWPCHLQIRIELSFYSIMSSAAPMKCRQPLVVYNNVGRGSNKIPSSAANMNYYHLAPMKRHWPRLQRISICQGSTKYHWPRIQQQRNSFHRRINSIVTVVAPMKLIGQGANGTSLSVTSNYVCLSEKQQYNTNHRGSNTHPSPNFCCTYSRQHHRTRHTRQHFKSMLQTRSKIRHRPVHDMWNIFIFDLPTYCIFIFDLPIH